MQESWGSEATRQVSDSGQGSTKGPWDEAIVLRNLSTKLPSRTCLFSSNSEVVMTKWRVVCAGAGLQVCPGRCCWSSERVQGPCPAQLPELAAWHEVSKQHTHWMNG